MTFEQYIEKSESYRKHRAAFDAVENQDAKAILKVALDDVVSVLRKKFDTKVMASNQEVRIDDVFYMPLLALKNEPSITTPKENGTDSYKLSTVYSLQIQTRQVLGFDSTATFFGFELTPKGYVKADSKWNYIPDAWGRTFEDAQLKAAVAIAEEVKTLDAAILVLQAKKLALHKLAADVEENPDRTEWEVQHDLDVKHLGPIGERKPAPVAASK